MGVFDTQRNSFININPRLYPLVIKVWFPLMLLYEYLIYFDSILPILKRKMPLEIVLILFNQIFVGFFFFFFFGISNLVIAIRYIMIKDQVKKYELEILNKLLPLDWKPKVQLLYTTYNDFIPHAILQCTKQTYSNIEVVILDNSNNPKYISMIDQLMSLNGARN